MPSQLEIQIPSTSARNPVAPEVNVTIPGMDKMAAELSSLHQAVTRLPKQLREEARQLVSSVREEFQLVQSAHSLGFFNGCGVTLVLSLIFYFVFSRKKNGP